ncbi:MAG: glycosyltransferase family 2 protein [Candidatus Korobacteraceae bacterium]
MHNGKTVSIVMPAYNEAKGIASVVRSFFSIPEVDQVIVADNNSSDDTAQLAAAAGAIVVHEPRRGYGHASQAALAAANSDYVIIVESDCTFRAEDIYKFLSYAGEFDVVFGTRTSKSCIWEGSNMGPFLRYGNCAVAKLLEYLHNGPCLTDVGCTYKLLRRRAVEHLMPMFTVGLSHFSPELMILAIRTKLSCVEIPVHYQPRTGTSKITGTTWKAFRLGVRMIAMIVRYRFQFIPQIPPLTQTKPIGKAASVR